MFYLEQSFKLIKTKAISFALFIVFGLSLIGPFMWGQEIETYLGLKGQEVEGHSYFHALVTDKENHSRLSRRLIELPGVRNVEILTKEQLKVQVEGLLKNIGVVGIDDLGVLDYVGLKITFNTDVSERSETLIRDYLVRLVGEDKVTLGAIHRPSFEVATNIEGSAWKKIVITFVLGVFWMLTLISLFKESLKIGYLVDKFQRKKNSGTKIFSMTMLLSAVSIFIALIVFYAQMSWKIEPNYIHIGMVATMTIITLFFCYQKNRMWQNY